MTSIAFFNNRGGVGKTTLVFHLAHVLSESRQVALVDLDPQSNASLYASTDGALERAWERGKGRLTSATVTAAGKNLTLLTAGPDLSDYEDKLALAWHQMESGSGSDQFVEFRESFRGHRADFKLVDLGPNLGPLNRAAIIGCDYFVIPTTPDLFGTRAIRRLSERLDQWELQWKLRCDLNKIEFKMPKPLGYIQNKVQYYGENPVRAAQVFLRAAEELYAKYLSRNAGKLLAEFKDIHSLAQKSQETRKPVWSIPGGKLAGVDREKIPIFRAEIEKLASHVLRAA